MAKEKSKPTDLREACVAEAFKIIADVGVEKLSLREVSRRLGVSHQAPYKHFPNRDHILAEVVAQAFDGFAEYLDTRQTTKELHQGFATMGACYMEYAQAHPLEYRLMFNTPLPNPEVHPGMMRNAQRAFTILRDQLAKMDLRPVGSGTPAPTLDALFVWSTLHGLASILQSNCVETLALTDEEVEGAIPRAMARIGAALFPVDGSC